MFYRPHNESIEGKPMLEIIRSLMFDFVYGKYESIAEVGNVWDKDLAQGPW